MSYWTYYLVWAVLAYGLRTPWFLVGIVVFLVLRRFIPAPGVLFRTLGRIRRLRTQVEANPANVAARRDLAWIYIERKRPGRALGLLQEALERTPNEAELSYLLGVAHHARREHERALAPLVRAVELDARVGFGEPYRVAADALCALGRYEEAVDAYDRFLDYNSSSVEGYLKRARALVGLGEREEASKNVDEALTTFSQLPGYARRKQLGWWFRSELARATIQHKPGAILLLAIGLAGMLGAAALGVRAVRDDLHSRRGFLPEHFGIRSFVPPVPSRDRFVRMPPEAEQSVSKIRTRWNMDDFKRGDLMRAHVGDFGCRLWAAYGPPDPAPKGFSYTLRDKDNGAVFVAYSSEAGPAYGMPIKTSSPAVSRSVDDFDALLDTIRPIDCKIPIVTERGTLQIGVQNGMPMNETADADD